MTQSHSLWLLPLPGAGRWLRLCLGLGGLGCGVGLELVLRCRNRLAGGSVGVAGGHQRGGHRLLGRSCEDLWRADTIRGQRPNPTGLWGSGLAPFCLPRRLVCTLAAGSQPCWSPFSEQGEVCSDHSPGNRGLWGSRSDTLLSTGHLLLQVPPITHPTQTSWASTACPPSPPPTGHEGRYLSQGRQETPGAS